MKRHLVNYRLGRGAKKDPIRPQEPPPRRNRLSPPAAAEAGPVDLDTAAYRLLALECAASEHQARVRAVLTAAPPADGFYRIVAKVSMPKGT